MQHFEQLEQAPTSMLRPDAAMQRDVWERAARLQQQDAILSARNSGTALGCAALGTVQEPQLADMETELNPVFVRQAIAEIAVEAQQEVMTVSEVPTQRTRFFHSPRRLLTDGLENVLFIFGAILAALCGLGSLMGMIRLEPGGFCIAFALGLLIRRPAKAFLMGGAVLAGELMALKWLSPSINRALLYIPTDPSEILRYSAFAGAVAVVGVLLQRIALWALTEDPKEKHRKQQRK